MMRIPEPSEGGSKETESGKDITMAKPDERHNELLKIKFSSSGDGGSGRGGLAVPFRPWELAAQWALRCTWRNTVYTGAESLSKWWWGGAHTVEIRVHQLKGDTPQVDVPSSTGNSSPDVIWLLILDAPRSAKKIFEYDFYLGEKQKPIKGITSPKKEAYQEEKKKKIPLSQEQKIPSTVQTQRVLGCLAWKWPIQGESQYCPESHGKEVCTTC